MSIPRRVMVIAEAGVNHNGRLDTAKRLIDAAAEAGADAVKFQSFRAKGIVAKQAPKAAYQMKSTDPSESMLEMISQLELSHGAQREICAHAEQVGITFLSSAFDLESVDFLASLGLDLFKVPSGEITHLPYLRRLGSLKKRVILSTGMSDLGEIEEALDVLMGAGTGKGDICLLHCTSEYPAPFGEVNLRAMITLRDAFQVQVGYSDHTLGMEIAIAAVALGASIIEKHLTLDRSMVGPDHGASLDPGEFKVMVEAIRNVEKALGQGVKKPSPSERKNRDVARKSIVAARAIFSGEIFSEDNVAVKRPGTGLSPMCWDKMIGRRASRDYEEDELLDL